MRSALLALTLLLGAVAPALADSYAEGEQLFEQGRYGDAALIFLRVARDDPRAAFALGRIYADGLGVPADHRQATRWFTRALIGQAESGPQRQNASPPLSAAQPAPAPRRSEPVKESGPRGHVDLGLFPTASDAQDAWSAVVAGDRSLQALRPQFRDFAGQTSLGAFNLPRNAAERLCAAARRARLDDCRLFF